jgi:hypothetical protein
MRAQNFLYEIITALALLGLAHAYLGNQRLLPVAQIMLIALYVLIAMATEALIVSIFQPKVRWLIGLNILVIAIVSVSGWTSGSSLRISASIGIGTGVLRALVAGISLRASRIRVRRITAALVGYTLVAETLAALYSTGKRIYYDYYFYPKVKEGHFIQTRWQDFVGHAVFLGAMILVLYLSSRLLKYAFPARSVLPE